MLTKIQSAGFIQNLLFNTNLPEGTEPCYNGNIAYSDWTYNGTIRGFGYHYDDLNRLTDASFYSGNSLHPNGSFDEHFTFDKMGNILTLQRKSNNTLVDDLALHYAHNGQSNQLDCITDAQGTQALNNTKEYQNNSKATSGEFAYDANGNMIKDLDRDIITIQNNILNLPEIIQFKNGNQIRNKYQADGTKLESSYYTRISTLPVPLADGQVVSDVASTNDYLLTGTDYIGNIEYAFMKNGNNSQFELDKIYNGEGFVQNLSNPQYYYYRRDHLGNNRELWCANTASTVQRTQYYPSGLPMASYPGDNPGLQERKFNGKELIEMHGLNAYDYGARLMISDRGGSWMSVDPLAEKYPNLSSYNYCLDNPVILKDPTGLSPVYDPSGKFLGTDNKGISGEYMILDKKNFKQGMDHSDAQKVLFHGQLSEKAHAKLDEHYANLSTRPDFDGIVTAQEGVDWAKSHQNALKHPTPDNMLYIDASKLDFGNISTTNFNYEGVKTPINLLNASNAIESRFNANFYNTVYALGRVYMVLQSRNNHTVSILNDYNQKADRATDYDWNAGGGFVRNILIRNEVFWQGLSNDAGFRAYYYGVGKLRE